MLKHHVTHYWTSPLMTDQRKQSKFCNTLKREPFPTFISLSVHTWAAVTGQSKHCSWVRCDGSGSRTPCPDSTPPLGSWAMFRSVRAVSPSRGGRQRTHPRGCSPLPCHHDEGSEELGHYKTATRHYWKSFIVMD